MFGWNQITSLKDKAGSLGSKMKQYANEMLVVEEDDPNQQKSITPTKEQQNDSLQPPTQQKKKLRQVPEAKPQHENQDILNLEVQKEDQLNLLDTSERVNEENKLIHQLKQTQEERSYFKQANDTLMQEKCMIQEQLDQNSREFLKEKETSQAINANLNKDIDLYIDSINKLEGENQNLLQQILSSGNQEQSKNQNEQIQQHSSQNELQQKYEQVLQDLTQLNVECQGKDKTIEQENEHLKQNHAKELQFLKSQIENLTEEIKQVNNNALNLAIEGQAIEQSKIELEQSKQALALEESMYLLQLQNKQDKVNQTQQIETFNLKIEQLEQELNQKSIIIEELSELKSKSSEMTQQLQSSLEQESQSKLLINNLNQSVESLNQNLTILQEKNNNLLENEQKSKDMYEKQIDSQLQEIATLRSNLFSKDESIDRLEKELFSTQTQFDTNFINLQRQLSQENDKQIIELTDLKLSLTQIQQQLQEAKNQEDLNKIHIQQLMQDLAIKEESFCELANENQQLEEVTKFLQKSLKGKVDDQETFDVMTCTITEKEKEIKDLHHQIKVQEQQATTLREQINYLQTEKSSSEDQIIIIQKTHLEELKNQMNQMEQTQQNQVGDEAKAFEQALSGKEQIIQQLVHEKQELEEILKSLRQDILESMVKIENFKEESIQLSCDVYDHKQRLKGLEQNLEKVTEDKQHLTTQIEVIIKEKDLEQSTQNLEQLSKIQQMINEKNELINEIEGLKQENHILNQQNTDHNEQIQGSLLVQVDTLQQSENKLKNLEIIINEKEQQIQFKADNTQQLEQRVIQLENIINDKEQHIKGLEIQLIENQNIIETLKVEIQNKINQNIEEQDRSILDKKISHYETKIQELTEEVEVLLQELSQSKSTLNELEQQCKLERGEHEKESQDNTILIVNLEQTNERQLIDLEKLKQSNEYLEGLVIESSQKIAPFVEQNDELKTQFKLRQDSYDLLKQQTDQQLQQINQENDSTKTQLIELQDKLSSLKTDKQTLTNNIIQSLEQYTQEYSFQFSSFVTKLNESRLFLTPIKYDDEFQGVLKQFNKKKQIQSLLETLNQKTQVQLSLLSECIMNELRSQEKNSKASAKKNTENYQQIQETYQKLQDSYNKLLEQQGTWQKKESAGQQEAIQNQKKLQEMIDKTNQIQLQLQQRDAKLKEAEKQAIDLDRQRKEALDEIQIKQKQYDDIKATMKQKQNENAQYLAQIQQAANDNSKQQDTIKKLQTKEVEYEKCKKVIEDKNYEVDQLNQGISNIQMMNEDLQQRLKFHEQNYEQQISSLTAELQGVQEEIYVLKQVREKSAATESHMNDYKNQLKKKDETIYRLQQEINEIKLDVNEQIQKLKLDTTQNQNMIDRRVISKFLVNYFDTTTQYQTKLQILETLGCILSFTPEEMDKIGLHKYKLKQLDQKERISSPKIQTQSSLQVINQGTPPITPQDSSKTLKQKFIGFLLDDE